MNDLQVYIFLNNRYLNKFKKEFPNFIFLPPVKALDLISLNASVIGIVDCVDDGLVLSTGEVVDKLRQGVKIYGASTFGSRKAIECKDFGMIGVGEINDSYLSHFEINSSTIFSDEIIESDIKKMLLKIVYDLEIVSQYNSLLWENQKKQIENSKIDHLWNKNHD